MKNLLITILALIIATSLWSSCKKFVEVGQPKNQLTTEEVFADSTDASAAILGNYIMMSSTYLGLCSGASTLYPALSADELYQTSNNTTNSQFYADNVQTDNGTINGFWGAGYKYIYAMNACIAGVNTSSGITVAAKRQITAEAKFVRAFVYFNLYNLFGSVPLVTTTDYQVNSVAPRASVTQLFTQIISDLQAAEAGLGTNTGTNDRPCALTAAALLAKVYLYNGQYAQATVEATKVISSGNYSLQQNLNSVFLAASNEIIWQLDLAGVNYTWEGQTFVPGSSGALPQYVITPGLYASFESGDQRVADWIGVNTVNGNNYPFPYKYKNNASATDPTQNYVILRLADQYLIRAEAEANQGNLADASSDLNMIRNRAGLLNSTATGQASILTAICNERRHELFCEWGNRWFDLRRLNLATSVLSPLKSGWKATDELYPIPVLQISADPYLTQNLGY